MQNRNITINTTMTINGTAFVLLVMLYGYINITITMHSFLFNHRVLTSHLSITKDVNATELQSVLFVNISNGNPSTLISPTH